jgi:hypothetical protein
MVLAHELAHVKRWDTLTYGAAYAACSLFWFVPFTWLALRRLKIEQEKACDEEVLSLDPRRADYAELLLGWAYRAPLPMTVAGLSMRNAAGKALEERIAHALRMAGGGGKKKRMPAPVLCLAGFLMVTSLSLVRCAPDNGPTVKTDTETQARTANETRSGDENIPRGWPLKGVTGTLTQKFGDSKDPFTGADKFHQGIDIAAGLGTPIEATANGSVIQTGFTSDYGNFVFIDHGNGFETRYTKLKEYTVRMGDAVIRGQVIGYLGNTGLSTGPHLHYEILKDGRNRDPLETASDAGTNAGGAVSR